jgi:hypothetical protein
MRRPYGAFNINRRCPRGINALSAKVIVREHKDCLCRPSEFPNLGRPLFQFRFAVRVIVALVGLLVLPPFLRVAPVETHICHFRRCFGDRR